MIIFFSFFTLLDIQAREVGNSESLKLFRHVQQDLSGVRELGEDVGRALVALRPPADLLPALQRALRNVYKCVTKVEGIHGYLDLVYTNKYNVVLTFAQGERRVFVNEDQSKRFRSLRKVVY